MMYENCRCSKCGEVTKVITAKEGLLCIKCILAEKYAKEDKI